MTAVVISESSNADNYPYSIQVILNLMLLIQQCILVNPHESKVLSVPKPTQTFTTALSHHKTLRQEYLEVACETFANLGLATI